MFAFGVEAGVKLFRCAQGGEDADIFGQPVIEREGEFVRGHPALGIRRFKMGDYAERVDAGVGAAGAVQAWFGGK